MSEGAQLEVSVVVFDLGGVLVEPGSHLGRLAALLYVDERDFLPAYWARRLEYDLGLEAGVYWGDVFGRLDVAPTPATRAHLLEVDSVGWTDVTEPSARLLRHLHLAGVRTAILSNATADMARAARASAWAQWVADWFFSVEIGIAKPDVDLYLCVANALSLEPKHILYFEDMRKAVDVAARLGWDANLWSSHASAEALLQARGILRQPPHVARRGVHKPGIDSR